MWQVNVFIDKRILFVILGVEINRDFKRDKKSIYREINEVYQNYVLIAKRIHVSLLIVFRKKKK